MLKLMITWTMALTFWATSVLAEGEPVKIFQLDFDLSPESAKKVAETRFDCVMDGSYCKKSGTTLVIILREVGKLSTITIRCEAFEGCAYSTEEIATLLGEQKSLTFRDIWGTWCATGTLGEEICVNTDRHIVMSRAKFRVPTLSFD